MSDLQETTLVFEHSAKTVELYTTSRRLWLRAIKRNPDFLQAQDLKPGYRLLYPMDAVKSAEMILACRPGGEDAVKRFLRPEEVAYRAQQAQQITQRLAAKKAN